QRLALGLHYRQGDSVPSRMDLVQERPDVELSGEWPVTRNHRAARQVNRLMEPGGKRGAGVREGGEGLGATFRRCPALAVFPLGCFWRFHLRPETQGRRK